ncbi:dynein axonemal assembly factor 4 [Toxorhynchites rutilus septentrionalis]|uniref:dynein axonemal assembly factor 4 n=1 Tax=Toxorhynchites rutilus septentrionalis TaxID=329112 RepID=UPI002478D33E|nr:dynein axonemal assembly factor 4 [Toxorhynchites rutilus septentrionalis]
MPVILENHTWKQDAERVTVRIPFPDNHLRPEQVFTSEQYLKINKPPYYWEATLLHPIVENDSRCAILENEVVFTLRKVQSDLEWETLEQQITGRDKVRLKTELLANHQKRLEERAKQRAVERDQKKRDEISKQIEREGNQRTEYEQLLERSKQAELKRMEEERKKRPEKKVPSEPKKSAVKVAAEKPHVLEIPSIRRSGTVEVTFSKRNFVTPKRESNEHDEHEWMRKLSEAKREVGFVDEDLRPEERNPEWLKQKGDTFFQQENYLAAISAYSAGIRLTKSYYSLFLNRSAAHFALENYKRCIEDCSAALELLVPPVEVNRKARTSCLARRGAALVKLGLLRQGHDEFLAALKLDPQNDSLRRDVEMIQRKLEDSSSDSDE